MDRYAFEEAIKAHLKADGRSQAAVARRLGYAPDTFNKWVRGVNQMPGDAIRSFCKLLNLSEKEFAALLTLAGHVTTLTEKSKRREEPENQQRLSWQRQANRQGQAGVAPGNTSAIKFLDMSLLNSIETPHYDLTLSVNKVIDGVDLPGFGKYRSLVRDSQGKLTLFVRYPNGELAFLQSTDNGNHWTAPTIFDRVAPSNPLSKDVLITDGAYPQLSAAVDGSDRIHVVWGEAPDAGNAQYGLLVNGQWAVKEIVGTGVWGRNIAVDSANHPHIVWSNIDLFHVTHNGQHWLGPTLVGDGFWNPAIVIDHQDDLWLFTNSARLYPKEGSAVHALHHDGAIWRSTRISNSPFWSGGASAVIDNNGSLFLAWIDAATKNGGADQVLLSQFQHNEWHFPFSVGKLNTKAGNAGQEAPAMTVDANHTLYIFWRGLDQKNRPTIFARFYTTRWTSILQLHHPTAANVWWPSVADVRPTQRGLGIDLAWSSTHGTQEVVEFAHITYVDETTWPNG